MKASTSFNVLFLLEMESPSNLFRKLIPYAKDIFSNSRQRTAAD